MGDGGLRIYYSCNSFPNNYIDCWGTRWDEGNWDVTLETYMPSGDRNNLFANVIPTAVNELYNILGTPKFIDITFDSSNSLIIEPNYSSQSGRMYGMSGITQRRTIGVKGISDTFLTPELFKVKIEGIRIDT